MKAKKVLFITQEISPYVSSTEMSEIGRHLPHMTQENGREIRTFMPKWGNINERRNQLHEVIRLSGMNLIISETDHPLIIKVASIQSARLQVYFIDNDDYFQNRLMATNEQGTEYADNEDRAVFYARGVLETVKKLRWCPDIIHCHGWVSAMAPFYIKTFYKEEPSFRDAKVIYSAYDTTFEAPVKENFGQRVMIKGMGKQILQQYNKAKTFADIERIAMSYSDGVIFNSEHVAPELMEHAKGCGIPTMDYIPNLTDYIASCNDFYERLVGPEEDDAQ